MIKINPTTAAAVGFAVFAAWYALRPGTANKAAAAVTGKPAAVVWDTLASQRLQVGNSLQQNGAYLDNWLAGSGLNTTGAVLGSTGGFWK